VVTEVGGDDIPSADAIPGALLWSSEGAGSAWDYRDTTPPPKIAYSADEAVHAPGLSAREIYRMVDRGELPARKVSRRVLISKAAVDAFIPAVTS
jgi:excisionase family DNA binding protein